MIGKRLRRALLLLVAVQAIAVLLAAFNARADASLVTTTAGEVTIVIVEKAPRPTSGFMIPTVEEAAVCGNWFVAPLAFFFLEYPAYRALEHNSATWRAIPGDKQDHFAVSAHFGGVVSAAVLSMPSDRSPWAEAAIVGGVCVSAGLAKEVSDELGHRAGRRDHGAEIGDLAADLAGCTVGVAAGSALGLGARYTLVPMSRVADQALGVQFGGRF